ncbi:hypothetical protein HYV82_06195 [Candidatus Woesearchaeota archaeon]|nr:hypothetical protein [Candidatus Woesearchaeota archaeon]
MQTLTLEALTRNVQGWRVTFTEGTTIVLATGAYNANASFQEVGRANRAKAEQQLQQFGRLTAYMAYVTNKAHVDASLLATISPNGAGFSLCVLVGRVFCSGNGENPVPNFQQIPLHPGYIISAGQRYDASAPEAQANDVLAWKAVF